MNKIKMTLAGLLSVMTVATTLCMPSAFASTTTISSESENNNTISTANLISEANIIKTGKLSTSSDVDYFKFTAPTSGYYDITLSVPSGCNYNFTLYDSNGNMPTDNAASGSVGIGEKCRKFIAGGNYYTIKIYSASGYSASSNYSLYISPAKNGNKTWYSQVDAISNKCDYNNYNLPSNFISKIHDDGCALTSIAMVLHNMNAQTKNRIYDFRTGYTGYMYADPYTVYMARMGTTTTPTSFTSSIGLSNDETIESIGTYFNKTAERYDVSTFNEAKTYADSYPQGVVVRFQQTDNSNYPSHYVVLVKSGSNYLIYDPGTTQESLGNGVLFTNSYAKNNMGFSESEVTEVITIS